MNSPTPDVTTRVIVAICTYLRNAQLEQLLNAVMADAKESRDLAAVGVVVVDDDPARGARSIAEAYAGSFELGLHYRTSGKRNIAIARNLAVGTAAEQGEWIAMTDDDCEPAPGWIGELLAVQRRFDADAVTGPCVLRLPASAPAWLVEQPFLQDDLDLYETDREVTVAATHNSLLRARWWADHPDVRFDPDLGVVGGEDMVFYRSARRDGLRIFSAHRAVVYGNEPDDRTTFRYVLARRFWLGNTSAVTRRETGEAGRGRLLLSAVNAVRKALQRPVARIARRESPQLRYCVCSVAGGLGMMIGALGVRVRHH